MRTTWRLAVVLVLIALCVATAALVWTTVSARRELARAADEAASLRRAQAAEAKRAREAAQELRVWQNLYDTWSPPLFAWQAPAWRRTGIDVLVVGGTPGGIGAALGAAKLGARVTLTTEYPWVGGAFTVEAVSVPDEAWKEWSPEAKGALGEFQQRVWRRYRDELKPNWLSSWSFLPWDGDAILAAMLRDAGVELRLNTRFVSAAVRNGRIVGAKFQSEKGAFELEAPRVVDATWNGDVAVACGCSYAAGREARSETGELWAPATADNFENAITYVLIVKDTGKPMPPPARPGGYDPAHYGPGVPWYSPVGSRQLSLYQYGVLPRGYVMLNWPTYGNDLAVRGYSTAAPAERAQLDQAAKDRALGFWYYLKTTPDFADATRTYDLASEFRTPDRLPFSPYHRSSRRIRCEYTLNANDIDPPFAPGQTEEPRPKVFDDTIAVGEYPMDVHGNWPNMPRVPPRFFTIPYRCLVPKQVDNLVIGDMAIGCTFLAQGATRLQATRMRVGQAAGVAAAASLKLGVAPRDLDPDVTQTLLVRQDLRIYPPGTL